MNSLKKLCLVFLFLLMSQSAFAQDDFVIQRAANGVFIIGGDQFTARGGNTCRGVKAGHIARFTESGPGFFCISAVFIDLKNGSECSVWCH